jgi:hypothetical protein
MGFDLSILDKGRFIQEEKYPRMRQLSISALISPVGIVQ